ncbi:MAG: shikimate kinase [bacterium]|nr:shikimate kinase [bacterium]
MTGFMGTGKSLVGKILAKKTGLIFVDTDELIVEQAGKSVNSIFEEDGEWIFRQIETKVILGICKNKGQVISTGGGAVTVEGNLNIMKESGLLVALTASPDAILNRIKDEGHRPLLKADNSKRTIEELLFKRQVFYKQADVIIDTTDISPDVVAEKILKLKLPDRLKWKQ